MDRSGVTPAKPANTLQTLDRGLQALTLISQQERGLSIAELAAQLAVDRAIAYRLVTTLESRGLITRADGGRLRLGAGLLILAARFEPQLRTIAAPLLRDLAQTTRAAAFLSVATGQDCVAIMVTEPEGTLLRVSYRVGSRHPLTRGAAGIAILAGRPPARDDPEAVRLARRDGYSVTRGELQRGAVGIASPVHTPDRVPAGLEVSIGVVAFEDLDVGAVKDPVVRSAGQLAAALWHTQDEARSR
ncbi:MAG TPA: helix-turn-helix domain-containing protein [Steroidobacteraceae bacterium]